MNNPVRIKLSNPMSEKMKNPFGNGELKKKQRKVHTENLAKMGTKQPRSPLK